MILEKPYTRKQYADFVCLSNENSLKIEDKGNFLEAIEVAPLTLSERAIDMSMPLDEFMLLAIKLSELVGQPITLKEIKETISASRDEIQIAFEYANIVKRNDPLLKEMTTNMGYPLELLDIMFVEKNNILTKIKNNEPLELPHGYN